MHRDEEQLLRYLDHSPPSVTAGDIAVRAQQSGRHLRLRWAAGFILTAALAGTAVAVPGSPVREWLRSRTSAPPVESVPEAAKPAAPPALTAGIAIVPGSTLDIEFTRQQENGHARVVFTDGDQVQVRAPGGAASFSTDGERLVIDNSAPSADYEIDLPRGAPWIAIRVAGTRVLLKQGDRVTLSRGVAQSASWIVPLTAAR
jgi:hypothetical protein